MSIVVTGRGRSQIGQPTHTGVLRRLRARVAHPMPTRIDGDRIRRMFPAVEPDRDAWTDYEMDGAVADAQTNNRRSRLVEPALHIRSLLVAEDDFGGSVVENRHRLNIDQDA